MKTKIKLYKWIIENQEKLNFEFIDKIVKVSDIECVELTVKDNIDSFNIKFLFSLELYKKLKEKDISLTSAIIQLLEVRVAQELIKKV